MTSTNSIEDRIKDRYAGLSAKLRTAADFVAENPVEVASRSLRSVAQTSGVSPATFSRLARALGYEDYEQLRESGRIAVGQKLVPFSERARALRARGKGRQTADFIHRQAAACATNIAYLEQNVSVDELEAAVEALHRASSVLLIASMGSAGLLDYFGYQANWFKSNWSISGRHGVSTAALLSRMSPGDVVLVLVKTPYARRSMMALCEARKKALTTIVLTDSHASPAMEFADHAFVVPSESPNFFSSYAATMVLLETMMGMLMNKAGPEAEARVGATEDQIRRLGENWLD